ncbi:Calmodulin-like protein 5 [Capsicum chinense]|uniref:Calmodulin-like protein 5 n=1 Tax=Capsicum annuum TaxID=4072 RepID=A0A1U8FML3_CAPAN|nr:calmodulin-like protein 7 [Capsicum annuum]PHT75556.1 Calmodulin-like protein 5 [Capsicum annuum]PHU11378.1 Calmodulin-like protein 5 [Capsicum chinense]
MLTISILFLALVFLLGLITTLFNFPSKKLKSWIFSLQTSTKKDTILVEKKSMKTSNSCTNSHINKVELKGIFATFDKNNDGYITHEELKQSLKNIGIFMEDKDIVEMVEKVDTNKDGLIDLDEFYELCHTFLGIKKVVSEDQEDQEKEEEGNLKDAFDVFDYDKDGLISEEELSKVLSSLGLKQGKRLDDCKEMIRNVDVDGDGMVNFDEFKKMMRGGGRLIPIS